MIPISCLRDAQSQRLLFRFEHVRIAPMLPARHHWGRCPKVSALLANGTSVSGAHTQDRAPGLSHNFISVRQRRTTIEGTMVVEAQDNQVLAVLAGEIENGRRRLSRHHVIADGKPRLASGEGIEPAAVSLHPRLAI